MFDEEISPEELFRQFFGGGMGGGFPGFAFDTGPQFVFNMGGPGIRVTQFGGRGPRARPRPGEPTDAPRSLASTITALLPLILLFIIPLLSNLLSGSSSYSGPGFRFERQSPYVKTMTTNNNKVRYFVDPAIMDGLSTRSRKTLDDRVEHTYVLGLHQACNVEQDRRDRMIQDAMGFIWTDEAALAKAQSMKMENCEKLKRFNRR